MIFFLAGGKEDKPNLLAGGKRTNQTFRNNENRQYLLPTTSLIVTKDYFTTRLFINVTTYSKTTQKLWDHI